MLYHRAKISLMRSSASPYTSSIHRHFMKRILSLIFTVLASSSAFCAGPIPTAPAKPTESGETTGAIKVADLCQHWIHSREEVKPGDKAQIFRPAAFKNFPPSRFRMQYKFDANGDCEWFYLSPTDAHHMKTGKWQLDPNDKTILQITKDGATESFKITTLTKDLLLMVPIEAKP